MLGIEFAITFVVGIGVFAVAVLPEQELQRPKRLAVVAVSFAGIGLLGFFLDQLVFTALGAATIPPLTLYYRTKDQRKRIESSEAKNAELTEAVQEAEETNGSLRIVINELRNDKTDLRDHNAAYLQAMMDIARNDLNNVVESLWEFYRLELVKMVTTPPKEAKVHKTRMVIIFSLIKMMVISYCQSEDELVKTLEGLNMSAQMKRKIITQFKNVQGEFRD